MDQPLFELRPCQPSDETFLRTLYASTRKEEVEAWGWPEAQQQAFLEMQFKAQHGSYEVQFPGADHQIIMRGGEPVGRLLIHRDKQELRLVDIALLPKCQGSGIGGSLIRSLLAEGKAAALPVRLQVVLSNPAIRLYERLGFQRTGDDGMYMQMEVPAEAHDSDPDA